MSRLIRIFTVCPVNVCFNSKQLTYKGNNVTVRIYPLSKVTRLSPMSTDTSEQWLVMFKIVIWCFKMHYNFAAIFFQMPESTDNMEIDKFHKKIRQRQFCRAQWKEREREIDRRRGRKTILRNETGTDFASSTRSAEDRTRWKKEIVVESSVVPQGPHKVVG